MIVRIGRKKCSLWIRGLEECKGYGILVNYCDTLSKSKGKLNKRLFEVIESSLSIAVKYAKRETDSYMRIC